MTPLEAAIASDDFAFLAELLASQELWLERAAEAEGLARRIVESASPIVVLLGAPRTGKTELLRRWIIPCLSRTLTVSHRDGCESSDDAEPGAEIEIWDSFERCLTDERIASGSLVADLTGLMQLRRKVVLIVGDESFSRLFQLSAAIPQLRGEILQVPLVSGDRVVEALRQLAIRRAIPLDESLTVALTLDLNAMPAAAAIGMELAAILLFQLHRSAASDRPLGKDDFVAQGGVNGILESYLDFLFERAPEGIDSQIAWAVVQEIVATVDRGPLNLDEVARRFEVPKDAPWRVVRWLEEERRVLRPSQSSGYALVLPQMMTALENRMRREALAVEHIHTTLQQGVRNFSVSEALPSLSSFKRVHSQRTAVKVTDEEATLMLRCALAYEDAQLPGTTDYWLQRIGDEALRIEVLFDGLFDADAGVRQRAVKRLAGVNQPEIRNQLHLLALRDPSPEVRAEAVGALDAIKDHDLRRSLLQEISEPNSPYRLHAIDALRVFAESEVTEALVDITRTNRPGEDEDARRKAIEVLGVQNTDRAVDALLNIALADQDAEDRANAASAMSSITDDTLVDRILDTLRQHRKDAARLRPAFSARALVLTPVLAILAALVVVSNVFVHGLLFAVMRRWRLAAAALAIEAVGVALMNYPESQVLGVPVLLGSMLLGTLGPLRGLLLERVDFKPQSAFRRCLSGVLFLFCAMTVFFYLHGLPSMLVRRVRRGLIVFGFETLGLLFLMSFLYFEAELAAPVTGLSGALFGSFEVAATLVLVVSYLMGVGFVLREAFILRARRAALERIDEVCSRLLQSPAVSEAVFRNLTAETRADARWSNWLVKRFGERMQEPLRSQWPGAGAASRRRIFAVLARRRDAATVEFLQSIAASLGWAARLRAFWAGLAFRFSVWPRPLLVALALILYALVSISAGTLETLASRPERLVRVVRNQTEWYERTASEQKQQDAVERLRLTAGQTRNHELAMAAITQLASALTSTDLPDSIWKSILEAMVQVATSDDHDLALVAETRLADALTSGDTSDERKADVLNAIVRVASAPGQHEKLVDSLDKLLSSRETEDRAIDALRRIGGPYASVKLARLTRDRIDSVIGQSIPGRPPDPRRTAAAAAAISALKALRSIQECGEETVRLVTSLTTRLAENASLQDSLIGTLADQVRDTAGQLDPLSRAEYYLTEQDFEGAIKEGKRARDQRPVDASRHVRAQAVLARAFTSRGSRFLRNGKEAEAKADLYAAIDTGRWAAIATDVVNLGLGVAYQYQEVYALRDPTNYDVVYDVLSRLVPVADTPETRDSVGENLAESSLTTGHYDQAIALSRDVATRSSKPSTVANMKYMSLAALAMKGDQAGMDAALADLESFVSTLPKDFTISGSYNGTRKYIERVAQGSNRQVLLKTLARLWPDG